VLAALAAMVAWRSFLTLTGSSPERTYNGFDTHADTLLIGCALALARPGPRLSEIARRFAAVPVAVLIAILTGLSYRSPFIQTVGFTLAGLATAWVIVAAMQSGWLKRALSVRPLTYSGRISYGLYLWHVPIVMLGPKFIHGYLSLLLIPLSFGVAALSYAYVEKPFLRLKARFEPSEQRVRVQEKLLAEPLLESA
jgi:peptidoglycan/LPS O-acetylase OafA/YrhL